VALTGIVRAAGGVVWRRDPDGEVEVVLVHRPAYDDWSIPKGKLKAGEDERDAALREVEEETGLRCTLGNELGTSSYVVRGRNKVARFWMMRPIAGTLAPAHETDEAQWYGVEAAFAMLSYERDRKLLRRFVELVSDTVPVYLLRHAKAGDRGRWSGPDRLRPLTPAGWRQGEGLVETYAGRELARLLSSPYIRCMQTLEALAADRGLPIEMADALAEGTQLEDVIELVRNVAADGPAVLCTHGDIQQLVVESLPPNAGTVGDFRKGSTWVLEVRGNDVDLGVHHAAPSGGRLRSDHEPRVG
jgi:phosphohistidine phosphatase SixA/8-oxo-dGTP pyrophosphatase MutT (NUDIX family)